MVSFDKHREKFPLSKICFNFLFEEMAHS